MFPCLRPFITVKVPEYGGPIAELLGLEEGDSEEETLDAVLQGEARIGDIEDVELEQVLQAVRVKKQLKAAFGPATLKRLKGDRADRLILSNQRRQVELLQIALYSYIDRVVKEVAQKGDIATRKRVREATAAMEEHRPDMSRLLDAILGDH